MYDIIVAIGNDSGIGKDGKIPWPKIDKYEKKFEEITLGRRM